MAKQIMFLVLMLVVSAQSVADENPTLINFALEHSYIPIGYDDNDRVQVTVAGLFPDSCYKVASVSAKVDEAQKKIFIRQLAYHYSGICIRVFIPFASVVEIGVVRTGDYRVVDEVSGKALGKLPVRRSTHVGADDYFYASVRDAFVVSDGPKKKMLRLTGEFPDRCSALKEVQVHYYPEVIVVQPILQRIGELCMPQLTRFSKEVPLDPNLRGVHLLHVRSLNGQAINKLADLDEVVD